MLRERSTDLFMTGMLMESQESVPEMMTALFVDLCVHGVEH